MTENNPISKKEQDFWSEFTKDIKPLNKKRNTVEQKESSLKPINIKENIIKPKNKSCERAKIDLKKAREIKRKGLKTEARLDLHGFTQDRAYNKLCRFIEQNFLNGIRNLLIITGKGKDFESSGILKQMLPRWLAETRFNKMILHITTAKQKDGGEGAFYVILRKKRD